jgi:hypothetical protein
MIYINIYILIILNMDDVFREYIDVIEELDELTQERKVRMDSKKELEEKIQNYLENNTDNKSKIIDSYKISIIEKTTTKGLAKSLVEDMLMEYFDKDGNTSNNSKRKANEITNYIFENRPKEIKNSIKITKPKIRKIK